MSNTAHGIQTTLCCQSYYLDCKSLANSSDITSAKETGASATFFPPQTITGDLVDIFGL